MSQFEIYKVYNIWLKRYMDQKIRVCDIDSILFSNLSLSIQSVDLKLLLNPSKHLNNNFATITMHITQNQGFKLYHVELGFLAISRRTRVSSYITQNQGFQLYHVELGFLAVELWFLAISRRTRVSNNITQNQGEMGKSFQESLENVKIFYFFA